MFTVQNGILKFNNPVTFTDVAKYADGSASAPSVTFVTAPTTGWYSGGSAAVLGAVSGVAYWGLFPDEIQAKSTAALAWASAGVNTVSDLFIWRDAANVLAQRNGTSAQAFRVYNTFTSAANQEHGFINWTFSGNKFAVGTDSSGAGSGREMVFVTDGTGRWSIGATSGHLLSENDNTYDIGASGATRPRTGYFGTSIVSPLIQATARVIFDGTTTSTGAGAVGITGSIHEITTTGTGDALTLANGAEGQRLSIIYVAEGAGTDTAVLTPTTFGSGSTITFSVVGQSAHLIFTNGKWYADSAPFGAVIA